MINYDQEAAAIYAQNKAVGWWDDPNRCIYQTLQLVSTEVAEATAKSHGYDLAGAMAEKLAYNRNRADHKRENRAKSDGKKF